MKLSEQLRILQPARENPALLAFAMVDLAHHALPAEELAGIKDALVATAVPHWCDPTFLAALLETTPEKTNSLLDYLHGLTLVESFPARGAQAVNVHEAFRLPLCNHLRITDPARWKALSTYAHNYANADTTAHARIEALYHLFAINQQAAADASRKLDQEFKSCGHLEARHALALALRELFAAGWLTSSVEALTLPLILRPVVSWEPEELGMRADDIIIRLQALAPRESVILQWIAKGKTDLEISQTIGVTLRTVRFHIESIRYKLGVKRRTELADPMLTQKPSGVTSKRISDHSSSLSMQELTILSLISSGKTNWEISEIVGVTEQTVQRRIKSILSKLNVTSRTEAAAAYVTNISQDLTA